MGSTYEFKCADCGYAAEVSGGQDYGFCVETQTGVCPTCDDLVDYTKRLVSSNLDGIDDFKPGVCPRCETPIARDWNVGDACPRCGGCCQRGPCIVDWD